MAQKNAEVSQKAQNTADYLEETLGGWETTANHKAFQDKDIVTVYSKEAEHNDFSKGSLINNVLAECPSLKVNNTKDGSMAVTFAFKND